MGFGGFNEIRLINNKPEEWHVGYVSTKGIRGIRGCSQPDYKIRDIPEMEYQEILVYVEKATRETQERKNQELLQMQIYELYLEKLPENICDFPVKAGVLEDNYGNYICKIPKLAAKENWDLEKLESWVENQLESFGE